MQHIFLLASMPTLLGFVLLEGRYILTGFSQRQFGLYMVSQHLCGGMRAWGFSFHHFADITPI